MLLAADVFLMKEGTYLKLQYTYACAKISRESWLSVIPVMLLFAAISFAIFLQSFLLLSVSSIGMLMCFLVTVASAIFVSSFRLMIQEYRGEVNITPTYRQDKNNIKLRNVKAGLTSCCIIVE